MNIVRQEKGAGRGVKLECLPMRKKSNQQWLISMHPHKANDRHAFQSARPAWTYSLFWIPRNAKAYYLSNSREREKTTCIYNSSMLISNINVIRDKTLSNRAVVKIREAEYNKLTFKPEKDKTYFLTIPILYIYF